MPKDDAGNIKPGDTDFTETWAAMEYALRSGKTRAIGVSNFSRGELEKLLANASTTPAVHQLELHPVSQVVMKRSLSSREIMLMTDHTVPSTTRLHGLAPRTGHPRHALLTLRQREPHL